MERGLNELKGLDLDGVWCEDLVKVREEVRKIFEKSFSTSRNSSVNLHNIEFPNISKNDNRHLTKNISDNEVEEAINECDGNKSPGPDGFNFSFIKHNWCTVKADVCQAVTWFQTERKIPKGCNASF